VTLVAVVRGDLGPAEVGPFATAPSRHSRDLWIRRDFAPPYQGVAGRALRTCSGRSDPSRRHLPKPRLRRLGRPPMVTQPRRGSGHPYDGSANRRHQMLAARRSTEVAGRESRSQAHSLIASTGGMSDARFRPRHASTVSASICRRIASARRKTMWSRPTRHAWSWVTRVHRLPRHPPGGASFGAPVRRSWSTSAAGRSSARTSVPAAPSRPPDVEKKKNSRLLATLEVSSG